MQGDAYKMMVENLEKKANFGDAAVHGRTQHHQETERKCTDWFQLFQWRFL
jgi:hypothetical protein